LNLASNCRLPKRKPETFNFLGFQPFVLSMVERLMILIGLAAHQKSRDISFWTLLKMALSYLLESVHFPNMHCTATERGLSL
jgi:hypothetical protein